MTVSFRIDAASFGSFLLYSEVVVRSERNYGTVVVTCDAAEVEFKPAGEPVGTAWTALRKH